ncbi:nitrilase [Elsinoe ampelina]|uniref:Nitrilase n=1 Tax=Elsinoe ampelina TaxID=302913 RepID=A0A6A6G9R4_9PEZI|nr:nitrilase [Elsinoe ampelina]
MPPLRVATAHISPIFLSASQTTSKLLSLIPLASSHSASLLVFPESFIPAFPIWSSLRSPSSNHHLFNLMHSQSLTLSSPEFLSIRAAARRHRIAISVGFSERAEGRTGTLWNSNCIIDETGEVVVRHRKLVPTFFEKLTWAQGDGAGLRVAEVGEGKARVGALICGENTNPLARYALMAQGEQVHVSTWPGVWPTRFAGGQEAQTKAYDNVAANRIRAAAHCFEAKCFGVLAAGVVGRDAVEMCVQGAEDEEGVRRTLEGASRGASMFLDPTGAVLPAWTVNEQGEKTEREYLQHEEGLLFCDLDLTQCVEGKQYHDVVGGYQRLDVFQLKVDRTRPEPATFVELETNVKSDSKNTDDKLGTDFAEVKGP